MYALTKPTFDKITIHLDEEYYKGKKLVITSSTIGNNEPINKILVDDKSHGKYFISHNELVNASVIRIE